MQGEQGSAVSAPSDLDDYLTLGKAAAEAPGRPSSNAVWRWCRRGVVARGGARVRLQHVRLGGRVYTTRRWLREFGERLAAADAAHFDSRMQVPGLAARPGRPKVDRGDQLSQIEQELRNEGL
jgi:hypothetical protein